MDLSQRYDRQVGLIYQENVADLMILITGKNNILPYLVTNLAFLGVGSSQGVIYLTEETVEKSDIEGQVLLEIEDIGLPLVEAVRDRIHEKINDHIMIKVCNDLDGENMDSVFVLPYPDGEKPALPTYERQLWGVPLRTGLYVGAEQYQYEFQNNALTPSVSAIAAGIMAQEALRTSRGIRPSEILSRKVIMEYHIRRKNLLKDMQGYNEQKPGSKGFEEKPIDFKLFTTAEELYAHFKPVEACIDGVNKIMPDEVLLKVELPETSLITRLLTNTVEVIEPLPPSYYRPLKSIVYSPFEGFEMKNGNIIEPEIKIPKVIQNKKVFFIGVGGLGSWSASLFNVSSTGCDLAVIDMDGEVEEHNLNRQILYTRKNIGEEKAEAAARVLNRINLNNTSVGYAYELGFYTLQCVKEKNIESRKDYAKNKQTHESDPGNVIEIPNELIKIPYMKDNVVAWEAATSDMIVTGPDNSSTRYLSSALGKLVGVPTISSGSQQFVGNVDLFFPDGECFVCRYGTDVKRDKQRMQCTGAIPTLAIASTISAVGAIQANFLIASLLEGVPRDLLRHYIFYSGKTNTLINCRKGACLHTKKSECPQHNNYETNIFFK